MNKLYILAAGLLALLAAACNKDDSTAAGPIAQLKVTGLKDTFTVIAHQDFLTSTPTVENENDYDYYWTLFSTEFNAATGATLIKPDTLARTKDLNYEVVQDPGAYILVFNAKEKSTGVVKQVNMVANITTLTLNGWYLVKDNGGKTDMDFIYPTENPVNRIDNWIAYYNGGKSLNGNAVSAVFAPSFRTSITSQKYFPVLIVASQNDAAIYRIDNGAMQLNFDNMFFTKPAVRRPQSVFQPANTTALGFINDGRAYNMTKGALFANLPVAYNGATYGNLSSITASAALDLGFDNTRKSVFVFNGISYLELKVLVSNGVNNGLGKLQNVNGNLQWMTGYTGSSSQALVLFRNPQDTGYLYKVDGRYGQLFYGTPFTTGGKIVTIADTLKPQHGLMNASAIGGNYDVDLIYYAVGSSIYKMDVTTTTESLQYTLPAGETVTAIQHIRYPETAPTVNSIAIATYNAGHYKVYLHPLSGTQTLLLTQPSFQGDGRVSRVIYMKNGVGSRVY